MHLVMVAEATLPPLAWCAEVDLHLDRCQVRHGASVHAGANWFIEGAWDGPFQAAGFLEAGYMIGSGGCLREGAVAFTTASHTLERLHWLWESGRCLVGNSLSGVLAIAGAELDPAYPFYESDLMSFVRGPDRAADSIPLRDGRRLHLLYASTLLVGPGATRRVVRRSAPTAAISDFAAYRAETARMVQALIRNASDPARHRAYVPLATLSSGYDSPACAVLAREAGCRAAVTFCAGRPGVNEGDDSGEQVGRALGMDVSLFERTAYLQRTAFPEAEFLAVGTGGEDVVMSALEPVLGGRVLVTGFLGDTVWGLPSQRRRLRDYEMTFPAGASLAEFRLRVDFLHLPIPQLQHLMVTRIQEVSRGVEMRPWVLSSGYDRPSPRRIAEEAGVPRGLFGQRKKAITQPFYWNEALAEVLSRASMADFDARTGEWPLFPRRRDRWRFMIGRFIHLAALRILWRRQALARMLGWPVPPDPPVSARYRQPLSRNVFAVHWGCATIAARYQALAPGAHPRP